MSSSLVANWEREKKRRASVAVLATSTSNPEVAARANALARRTGVPADVVERNLPEVENRERSVERARQVQQSPEYVQRWLSDPRNAAALGDDLKNLVGLAKFAARDLHEASFRAPPPAKKRATLPGFGAAEPFAEFISKAPGRLGVAGGWTLGSMATEAWNTIEEGIETAASPIDFAMSAVHTATGIEAFNPAPVREAAAKTREQRASFFAGKAEAARKDYASENPVIEGLLQGTESVPLTLYALLTRDPKAAASVIGGLVGAQAYQEGRKQGLDAPSAARYAIMQGIPEAAFEIAPSAELLKVAGRGFATNVVKYLQAEVPGEIGTTLVQSFSDWVSLNPQRPYGEWVSGLPTEVGQTVLGVLGGGAVTVAGQTGIEKGIERVRNRRLAAEAVSAKAGGAILDNVMEGAQATKLRETDPEAFQEYIAGLSQNTAIENVYLPGSVVRELMQGDPENPLWQKYGEQIEEATAIDGDVVIPLAEVATSLAGTPEWNKLRPEARFSPGGMSEAELETAQEQVKANAEGMRARLTEQADAATAAAEPAQRVYEDVYNRLLATGRAPKVAARDAAVFTAQRETTAQALGVDAWTYHSENPVEFRSPEGGVTTEGRGRVLAQRLEARHARRVGDEFETFDPSKSELGTHFGSERTVSRFGKGRSTAETYAITLNNPLRLQDNGSFRATDLWGQLVDLGIVESEDGGWETITDEQARSAIQAAGYDGVVYLNRFEDSDADPATELSDQEYLEQVNPDATDSYIIFDPAQIEKVEDTDDRRLEQARDRGPGIGRTAPLEGAPSVAGATGPIPEIVAAAQAYAQAQGIPFVRQAAYAEIDPEFSKRVADAYEAMEHAPDDPAVKVAYTDMIRQTRAQYDALVAAGFRFWFTDPTDPANSSNPWDAMRQLRSDKTMAVFSTEDGFGSSGFDPSANPLLVETGIEWPHGSPDGPMKRVLANDLFRAVHDAFGHGLEGAGFRARGEENAWQAHARLYEGPGLAAMTSETRGQNSWLNFGPYGEANRTAKTEDTKFADQKTGLLPEWAWTERVEEGEVEVRIEGNVPTIVFHGTPFEFERFLSPTGKAVWFTESRLQAKRYADPRRVRKAGEGRIVEATIQPTSPLVLTDNANDSVKDAAKWAKKQGLDIVAHGWERKGGETIHDIVRSAPFAAAAREAGHDAIEIREGKARTWGIIEPNSVRSPEGRMLYQDAFYSALERAVEAVSTKRAPAQQWLATLRKAPGVKAEELEWTGLEEWLSEQTAPVEKDDVVNVLKAGAITVEERVLGEIDEDLRDERRQEIEEQAWEQFSMNYEPYYAVQQVEVEDEESDAEEPTFTEKWVVHEGGTPMLDEVFDDEQEAYERADELDQDNRDEEERRWVSQAIADADLDETDAAWRSYSLVPEGDDSYRELLLYFPYGGMMGERMRKLTLEAPTTHWDQESAVVAHARFHDRMGPNGEKILFLDEIQSDWHQQGREQGYNEPADPETQAKAQKAYDEAAIAEQNFADELKPLLVDLHEKMLSLAREVAKRDVEQRLKGREGALQAEGFEKSMDSIVVELRQTAKRRARLPELENNEKGSLRSTDYTYFYSDLVSSLERLTPGEDTNKALLAASSGLPEAYEKVRDAQAREQELASTTRLRQHELQIATQGGGIPNAPFKNTWPMLVMKRVIVWAAEGGYDQVAWIKQGENNGGMNDNVGWFYEKVLPNETNKLLKKYGAKVRPLTVAGLAKMVSPREAELREQMRELDKETSGVARQMGAQEEVRERWQEARQGIERKIARETEENAEYEKTLAGLADGSVASYNRPEWYRGRINEKKADIAVWQEALERTADFDAMWAKNREYWALEAEAAQLADTAGTNLGFDITPELKDAAQQGFALFQRDQGGARGRISGGIIAGQPGPTIIDIMAKDDPSTVIHEFGHLFVEELRRNASRSDAPEWMKADWRALEAWCAENGHPIEGDYINTEAHELLARGFERYLMEGKAPTPALVRVFRSISAALLRLYKHVLNLNSPITPEVRKVFDRMLATQEAIDEAADHQATHARFRDAQQAGMTTAAFEAYRALADEARSEAFDALLYRTMESIRRERTRAWQEEQRRVRDGVTEEVNAQPVFRALHLLRSGRFLDDPEREPVKLRLDKAWLEARGVDLGALPKNVPPIFKESGDDPETVANMAGFKSADEMISALIETETQKNAMWESGDKRQVKDRVIADETARIMAERHGSPLDDGSIEEEALAAVNNIREGEVIAAEHRQLGKRTGVRPTAYSMAREWAKAKIAQGRVVDVASRAALQRYARAQAKAARAFEAALLADNVDEAFRQSEIRLLNHALIAEAKAAADRVEVAVNRLSKTARQRTRKSIDQDYFDRALALLEKFEFRAASQASLNEREAFAVWATRQAEAGVDVITPPRLEANGVHYSRMSVEELIALDDSVSQLLHLGRRKKRLMAEREQRDYEERRGLALAVIEGIPQKAINNRLNPNRLDRIKNRIAQADAALLKMEQVFDWLDDGNPNGFFNTYIFKPIAAAQAREREMIGDYLGQVRDLMRAIPKETVRKWEDKFSDPRLLDREKGEPFDMVRQDLITMALNVGNEGNFAKLTGGYGWNRDTVMEILDEQLTAEEWQFVQATWDMVNTLWPEIAALEKRVNGVAPEKVEPRSFALRDGTQMRGGYYPVVYDPRRSQRTEQLQGKETDALFGSNYGRATTRQGFAKERTDVERPIHLSLSVLNRHLTDVIHDLTHREIIMQADRILSDSRVTAAVDDALGPEVRKQFRPWLSHIANEWAKEGRELAYWEAIAKKLRTHSTIIGMGFRITSILSQFAGYAGIVERIGPKWWAVGMKAYGNPIGSFEFVAERSQEVRNRMDTLDRDIDSNVRDLAGRTGLLANARRYAFFGIGAVDRMVVTAGWTGAYHKGLSEGMSEDDAAYYADKIIRTTQGAGGAKDLAAIQRSGEWMRLVAMFYSYASAFYNRQRALGRDLRSAKTRDFPALLGRAFLLFAVGPVLGQLPSAVLSGFGPDEDEEETWLGWSARLMMSNFFYGIPIARDIASSYSTGFDYALTPATRAIETVAKAGGDIGALIDDYLPGDMGKADDETEPSKRAVKTGVEAVGYVTRLPVGQVANAAQFLSDWANGEADPDGVGEWLTGLQRGKLEE